MSNTWRTDDQKLIELWNEVREHKQLITEKMAMDGPFSEELGANLLKKDGYKDNVVLCLNYDGKFGLNNMNNYFQCANHEGEAVVWGGKNGYIKKVIRFCSMILNVFQYFTII